VHLLPREIDKLVLHQAGVVAQKRLARGLRLNVPETTALVAAQLLEFIRDGRSVSELMTLGKKLLGRNQVLHGVPELVSEVQVEGTFADGTKLVTVHHPIASDDGDLTLALHGSFLPVPALELFKATPADLKDSPIPGEFTFDSDAGELELNAGRRTASLAVTNRADRPIQVGSHYHFIETNPSLAFDRRASFGLRLDIPAGTAVRFEPGETRTVQLVEIAGNKVIRGGNGLVDGPVDGSSVDEVLARLRARGFADEAER